MIGQMAQHQRMASARQGLRGKDTEELGNPASVLWTTGAVASVGRESLGPREGQVEDLYGVYSKPVLVWTPECARAIKELLFLSHHPVF